MKALHIYVHVADVRLRDAILARPEFVHLWTNFDLEVLPVLMRKSLVILQGSDTLPILKHIKTECQLNHLIVLVMGSGHLVDVNEAYTEGANSYITLYAQGEMYEQPELDRILNVTLSYWSHLAKIPVTYPG